MRYALFLGCTVPARARNYELSARAVAKRLGIELVDIDGFACCGFPIRPLNKEATHLMATRNLALAQERGLDILTLCSACTGVLTEVAHELEDEEARNEVNAKLTKISKEYKGGVKVRHIARLLYEEIGLDRLKGEVSRGLSELKVAPHYGCHYLKPSSIYGGFDNPEDPKSLHKLIELTGAAPVDYENLKACCGGGVLAVNEEVALNMAGGKLDHITSNGADCMALLCPFCSVMYDDNQRKIGERREKEYNLPILYYTQLLGLAMGLDPKSELGVQFNKVKAKDLLAKLEVEV
jgi:heterodisulfide reductase subunit B